MSKIPDIDEELLEETKKSIQRMIDCLTEIKEHQMFVRESNEMLEIGAAFLRMSIITAKPFCTLASFLGMVGNIWENAPDMEFTEIPKPTENN